MTNENDFFFKNTNGVHRQFARKNFIIETNTTKNIHKLFSYSPKNNGNVFKMLCFNNSQKKLC